MPLERGDEHREKRLERLAADTIGRFPEHDERIAHGRVV
jgi:hypothetical protein